jgi:predicted Zn-dependent protease
MIASFGLKMVAFGLGGKKGIGKDLILAGSQIGTNLLLLKNSRENEFEADNEGVRIMNDAGYNPSAMIQIQEMLLKLTGGKNPPAIISTHPPSQERIKMIKKQIAGMGTTSSAYNENEYLHYIEKLGE